MCYFQIFCTRNLVFFIFYFLVPGNLNLKFPTRFKHFNLFSPINFPFKRHVPHVFKLWLDNELSNIRTFHSITMLMLSLIYIKPICKKNIVSNTLKPDFVGKNVTCGTKQSQLKNTSRVGHFQLFPNVPEQWIEQYKNFLLMYLSHAMFYTKKLIFEKKTHLLYIKPWHLYRHVWDKSLRRKCSL